MNKISMSQTYLYNISYKKAMGFYNNQSAIHVVRHNTNFA